MRAQTKFAPIAVALAVATLALAFRPTAAHSIECPADYRAPIFATFSPPAPLPGDSVQLVFHSCLPCVDLVSAAEESLGLVVRARAREVCPAVCIPDSVEFNIGRLAAGNYRFTVIYATDLSIYGSDSLGGAQPESLVCHYMRTDTLTLSIPPIPPGLLPYVSEVRIGGPAPCDTCPPVVCPGDSIPVQLSGSLPDDCIQFMGVQEISLPYASPMPRPPMLRVIFGTNSCLGRPCVGISHPWSASLSLPPLPSLAPGYQLPVEVVSRTLGCAGEVVDSVVSGPAFFPFRVAEGCSSNVTRCFSTGFQIASSARERCDAFVSADQPGRVVFEIGSGVPLFGLQGSFVLDSPAMVVGGVKPIGAAQGMHLSWTTTATGARFVLFTDGTAHIPAVANPVRGLTRLPILAIEVRLAPDSLSPVTRRVRMRAGDLLGSDEAGVGVKPCPIIYMIIEPPDAYASFCTGSGCDFNGDGGTDVRDLVSMVRCLRHPETCPADTAAFDCDQSGRFDLGDVFCCARSILHPGVRDSVHGAPDPSLRVTFGTPVRRGGVLEVPVTLRGDHPIGGARLAFSYPGDRYQVSDVGFPEDSDWLGLYQDAGGRVDVGMLDVGGSAGAGPVSRQFTLRLALLPGVEADGQVALVESDISDPDGARVLANLGAPSVDLHGASLDFSPPRPNPFGRATTFALTLAKASDLAITVHDVSGRVVATLHRGVAMPGAHSFVWNGTRGDGSRAADGIYFIRARVDGETVARKVVLLRQP
jgi:hypothetical protein